MNTEDHHKTPAQERRWKEMAKYACGVGVGVAVVVGATVVVTLVVTHGTAQRENLIAYLHGQVDGLQQGGWMDGWNAAAEWYAEHSSAA